jgi:hypothetical protein
MVGYGSALGKQNWEQIFKKALSPLSENDLKRFLDIFSTISEGNQQAKENTINADNQAEIFSYIIRSIELTKRINSDYRSAIEKSFYAIETGGIRDLKTILVLIVLMIEQDFHPFLLNPQMQIG